MIDNLGISFSPLNNPSLNGQNQNQNAGVGNVPLADAIRMLSLRLPRFVGARGIAPSALLNAPGLAGVSPDVLTLLRQLFGQFSAAAPMGEMARAESPYAAPMGATSPYAAPYTAPTATSYPAPYAAPAQYTAPTATSFPGPSVTPGQTGQTVTGPIVNPITSPDLTAPPPSDFLTAIGTKVNYQQNPYGF